MTFQEKYKTCNTWQDKAIVMSLYHTAMTRLVKEWTIRDTAEEFEVSVGLVSENIRLANAIDAGSSINKCSTRQEALNKVERRRVYGG